MKDGEAEIVLRLRVMRRMLRFRSKSQFLRVEMREGSDSIISLVLEIRVEESARRR